MRNRRVVMYTTWSRPKQTGAELGTLENRYPTVFETRRQRWLDPDKDHEYLADRRQGIDGALDLIFESRKPFLEHLERSNVTAAHVEREDEQGAPSLLDDALLSSTDTLIIQGLDHDITGQVPSAEEVKAIERFLGRPETDLVVAPHHVIGNTSNAVHRKQEAMHHGDRTAASQDLTGRFSQRLLEALGFPIEVRYGLNPAVVPGGEPEPLDVCGASPPILEGVTTFGAHAHLPELHVPETLSGRVEVLARQKINPNAPKHPHLPEGQEWFNAFLWIPPSGERKGNIFVCDLTLFSLGFKGVKSLKRLWTNLATRAV